MMSCYCYINDELSICKYLFVQIEKISLQDCPFEPELNGNKFNCFNFNFNL